MSKFINRFLTVVTIAAMVLSAIFMIVLFGSVIGLTAQASNIMSAETTGVTGVSAPTGMGADITILLVFLGVVFFIEEGVLLGSIFLRKAIFKKIQAKKAAKKLQESKQVA